MKPAMTELPPTNTLRWVARRKAAVVAAVSSGMLTIEEACRRYHRRKTSYSPGSTRVHSIPKDVTVLDYCVPYINADAELDALVRGPRGIALDHASLHLGRTLQGIDHTAELDQKPVTRRLDQPAIVRGDRWINQLGPDSPQCLVAQSG